MCLLQNVLFIEWLHQTSLECEILLVASNEGAIHIQGSWFEDTCALCFVLGVSISADTNCEWLGTFTHSPRLGKKVCPSIVWPIWINYWRSSQSGWCNPLCSSSCMWIKIWSPSCLRGWGVGTDNWLDLLVSSIRHLDWRIKLITKDALDLHYPSAMAKSIISMSWDLGPISIVRFFCRSIWYESELETSGARSCATGNFLLTTVISWCTQKNVLR